MHKYIYCRLLVEFAPVKDIPHNQRTVWPLYSKIQYVWACYSKTARSYLVTVFLNTWPQMAWTVPDCLRIHQDFCQILAESCGLNTKETLTTVMPVQCSTFGLGSHYNEILYRPQYFVRVTLRYQQNRNTYRIVRQTRNIVLCPPCPIHPGATCTFSHLVVHVAQHKVQQEGLPLAEGPSHRHHHHVEVLHVVLQQDVLQGRLVQLKAVLLLVGQDDLDGPGHFLLCDLLE